MADVTLEDVHIASLQTKDNRNNTVSLTEVMQYCLKISKKLDTLIDIFKDGYASVSPVPGRNYSTSRNGRRYSASRDRGRQKSPSNTKNKKKKKKKQNSRCNIHTKKEDRAQTCYPPCNFTNSGNF